MRKMSLPLERKPLVAGNDDDEGCLLDLILLCVVKSLVELRVVLIALLEDDLLLVLFVDALSQVAQSFVGLFLLLYRLVCGGEGESFFTLFCCVQAFLFCFAFPYSFSLYSCLMHLLTPISYIYTPYFEPYLDKRISSSCATCTPSSSSQCLCTCCD